MNNLHNNINGQTEEEKKLHAFLMEYATEDEIDQLGLYIDNKEFDQADMVIYTIMARITG